MGVMLSAHGIALFSHLSITHATHVVGIDVGADGEAAVTPHAARADDLDHM
eukprot:CAMPEP_0119301882 /NCGR_PEP_ID=MMETSP1333-20130426/3592_1 /TAXON_ID=418940 /ORGANISM="Scyphosphaera apsteinii, Strain RCC1455" /LENGTH=50 /DNA_ID=CAMNT_0007304089 /DNA_START=468 /DNA_END=620 /DNA_ORIENTATION=-